MFQRVLLTVMVLGGISASAEDAAALKPGAVVRLTPVAGDFEVPGIARRFGGSISFPGTNVQSSSSVEDFADIDLLAGGSLVVPAPGNTGRALEGTLIRIDDQMITILRKDNREAVVPLSTLSTIAVRTGRKSRWRGAGLGALVGALVGVGFGLSAGDDTRCSLLCFSAQDKALIFGILLTPVGTVIGAVHGGGPRWSPVGLAAIRPIESQTEFQRNLQNRSGPTRSLSRTALSVSLGW
jgi:hypothetical protein